MRRLLVAVAALVALAPLASPAADAGTTETAAPSAPTGVTARPLGRSSLAVRWKVVPGAVDYELFAKPAEGGDLVGPVHAAGSQGEIGGLVVGQRYVTGVRSRGPAGTSPIAWGSTDRVLPDQPPVAVTGVTAAQAPNSTRLNVTWTAPTAGIQPDLYAVLVTTPEGAPAGALLSCDFPCRRRTVDGLEPGRYVVQVAPLSWSGGLGAWTAAPAPVTVTNPCAGGGACLTVAAGTDRGPADLRAQGINANLGGADLARLADLHVRDVRGSDQTTYEAARALGARFTWLLSNSWYDATYDAGRGGALAPWADWGRYQDFASAYGTAFSAWAPVDYVDVQNEPYVGYLTPPGTHAPFTPDQLGDQVARARAALRAADPGASIVGPSFDSWNEAAMRQFLDEAVERGVTLAAVSWHELSPTEGSVNHSPTDVAQHVARVRELLAERPSLGSPAIHVNEYGGPTTGHLAGWDAGFVAALEDADVDLAMRSCWSDVECAWHGAAGGLFEPDTGSTLAPYWVHRFYADQTGRRVATSTTNANVTSFATRDGNRVRVLVGRHQQEGPSTAAPFDVPIDVRGIGGSSATVVLERVPATDGPVPSPVPVARQSVTVAGGTAHVVLPKVADGEAWFVTVTW